MLGSQNLTVIFYSASRSNESFTSKIRDQIKRVSGDLPIISVSQKPLDFGENICLGNIGFGTLNVFKQALIGAKAARTKYIAMAEEDVLYGPEHFKHIPESGTFAYNTNVASIYTYHKPLAFFFRNRRVLHSMICERDLFIEAMEERFALYPDPLMVDKPDNWNEPGVSGYEKKLGVTKRVTSEFQTEIPNVVFNSEENLGFRLLGKRKKINGYPSAMELPYHGKVEDVIKIYLS